MARRKRPDPENPWDRIPGETPRQFQKFCAYRDQILSADKELRSRQRNIKALAKDIGFSVDHLRKLSAKNNWVDRCAAYDAYLDEQIRIQNEKEIIKMRKDHALLASQMIKKAAKRLLTIPEDEIAAAEIVRLVDVGVKIERLSRGEATENKKISGEATVTHSGTVKIKEDDNLNLADLSDEELLQLEQLLEKLHPEPEV